MKHITLLPLLFLVVICLSGLAFQGCVPKRTSSVAVPPVEILHSEIPRLNANPAVEPSIYVGVRDAAAREASLRSAMEAQLRALGYTVTDSPSRAGYILQLHVLRMGEDSPDSLRAAVPAGYGAALPQPGGGASVLLTDVLLALRTPPAPTRQSHVIKSTSTRSTVGYHQMRAAALAVGEHLPPDAVLPVLEEQLARNVAAMLPPPGGAR